MNICWFFSYYTDFIDPTCPSLLGGWGQSRVSYTTALGQMGLKALLKGPTARCAGTWTPDLPISSFKPQLLSTSFGSKSHNATLCLDHMCKFLRSDTTPVGGFAETWLIPQVYKTSYCLLCKGEVNEWFRTQPGIGLIFNQHALGSTVWVSSSVSWH